MAISSAKRLGWYAHLDLKNAIHIGHSTGGGEVAHYLARHGESRVANLRLSLILWPAAMIMSLVVVGFVAPFKWPFLAAAFVFGVASFANVPPMQMRVMKYGKAAPELAATANISAFNIANALGGLIGRAVVDSSFGANAIPFWLPNAQLIHVRYGYEAHSNALLAKPEAPQRLYGMGVSFGRLIRKPTEHSHPISP